jgi:hypothetical protein
MAYFSFYDGSRGGWIIVHKEHDGTIRDILRPMNLEFRLQRNDAHDITYDISKAEPSMRWSFVGPYRTEWELWLDDKMITSGWHTQIITKKGEEVIHVAGKGYLNYLQVRHYPFNPDAPNQFIGGTAANNQGVAYQKLDDVANIISEVLEIVLARPNSMNIHVGALNPLGQVHGLRIELGDTTFVYNHILPLSELHPGFDFWCDIPPATSSVPEFNIGTPFVYDPRAVTDKTYCIHTFDGYRTPTDVVDVEFDNSGPAMTHILALGQGTSSRLGVALSYDQSEQIFYRIDGTLDESEVMTKKHLTALAQAQLSHDLWPQHLLPLVVKPDEIPGFWEKFIPGEAIWLKENFESNNVDNACVINQIHGIVTDQGDCTVELAIEDIHKYGNPGTVRG